MPEEAAALNHAQRNRVLSIFAHADALLRGVEALCDERTSLFAHERPDLTGEDRARFVAVVHAIRNCMLNSCARLGIAIPEPSVSARWSAETKIHFAGLAFAELTGRAMNGYGPMPPALGEELSRISSQLCALTDRSLSLSRAPSAGDGLPGLEGEQVKDVPPSR